MADKKITYDVSESSDDDSVLEDFIDPLLDPLANRTDKTSVLDQLRMSLRHTRPYFGVQLNKLLPPMVAMGRRRI